MQALALHQKKSLKIIFFQSRQSSEQFNPHRPQQPDGERHQDQADQALQHLGPHKSECRLQVQGVCRDDGRGEPHAAHQLQRDDRQRGGSHGEQGLQLICPCLIPKPSQYTSEGSYWILG